MVKRRWKRGGVYLIMGMGFLSVFFAGGFERAGIVLVLAGVLCVVLGIGILIETGKSDG